MKIKNLMRDFLKTNKQMQKGKHGIAALQVLIVGTIMFVVASVVLTVGGNILNTVFTQQVTGSLPAQIANNGTTGLVNVASNFGLLGTILILSVIVMILTGLLLRSVVGGVR